MEEYILPCQKFLWWLMHFYGECILIWEGHRRFSTSPSLGMQCRALKYNRNADGLCSVVEDEKKNGTRTLERFDKSEDWLAVYWGA